MEPCSEKQRLERIERDVRELQASSKEQDDKLGKLAEGQAETRIYLKQIFDRLEDLKVLFQSARDRRVEGQTNAQAEQWTKVVIEVLKYGAIVAGILGGVRYLT